MEIKEFLELSPEERVGWHRGVPMKVYRHVPAISYTGWKHFGISPKHYKAYLRKPEDLKVNEGAYFHWLLEGEPVESKYELCKKSRIMAGDRKEAAERGVKLINQTLYDKGQKILETLHDKEHEEIREIIKTCDAEVSGFVVEPEFGFAKKFRPDLLRRTTHDMYDWKCISPGMGPHARQRMIHHQGWAFQGGEYTLNASMLDPGEWKFWHLFVETDEPFDIYKRQLNPAWIDAAQTQLMGLYPDYAQCLETDYWPGLSQKEEESTPPGWLNDDDLE